MKWSMFTFHVELEQKYIVYNTINGSVVSINKQYHDLSKLKNKKIINYLLKNEFIYDKDFNEKNRFLDSLVSEWNTCDFLGLHILTTTGCNFKCPYCYQSGIKECNLKKENAKKLISFLKEYIEKNNIKECNLEITGGEPTINFEIIYLILPKIISIFRKNKVKYKLFIVTNGYLLTKEKVDFLSKYNWKRLQITLDGMPEVNNNRRILKNGKDSFGTIINNLDYIISNNKIETVNLRINYDNSNIHKIPEFLEYIKNRYGTKKIILSLGLITKTIDSAESNKFIDKYGIIDSSFFEKYIYLYKIAHKLEFKMNDIFSFDGFCTSKLKHGFVIEPNGNIVKCISGVGRKDFLVGNISDNNLEIPNYLYTDLYVECLKKECPFLPLCHTGCRFESYIKTGDKRKSICKREILEKINKELLTINYKGDD